MTYTYNTNGALSGLTDWAGRASSFGYDADGNPTSIAHPDGTVDTTTSDTAGQATAVEFTHGQTSLARFDYTHNNRGLISQTAATTTTATGGTTSLSTATGNDSQGRLTTAVGTPAGPAAEDTTYAYDPAGSITTLADRSTLAYDRAGRTATRSNADGSTAATYGYDAGGNRTATTTGSGGTAVIRGHSYDAADRLTAVTEAGLTTAYAYDGDGLRAATTTAAGTETVTWDSTAAVAELLTDSTHRYLYGPDGNVVEQTDTAGTNPSYPHADSLGSTRMLTTAGTAGTVTVTGTWAYSAYGALTAHTGTGTTPFGYAGQYTDPGTGYQYLRARYYDPATAQFLTRDPLEDTTRAAYGYAGGNPLQFSDPTGLDWLDAVGEWAAGFGDMLTAGNLLGTRNIRRLINYALNGETDDMIDNCTEFYKWGGYGGIIASLIPIGGGLGAGLKLALGARSAKAADGVTRAIGPKVAKQMGTRGWTEETIDEATRVGRQVRAVNKANGNPATRYISPRTGQSVVVDDVTGEVIHVGGPGFQYGPGSGDLP